MPKKHRGKWKRRRPDWMRQHELLYGPSWPPCGSSDAHSTEPESEDHDFLVSGLFLKGLIFGGCVMVLVVVAGFIRDVIRMSQAQ